MLGGRGQLREGPLAVGSQHRTYINGSLKHTYDSPGGSFYDKFGAYRTNSGQGPATVVWSGIRFWRK